MLSSTLSFHKGLTTAIRSIAAFPVGAHNRKQLPHRQERSGHTVRVIAREDFPHGKAYKDDVIRVKAGYARNFRIRLPKNGIYATSQNI
jgi:Ribosomal protein L9, N-terminal domain